MHNEQSLLKILDELEIKYDYRAHEPVFTCEQANAAFPEHKGAHCKNLFLKDADGKKWLVVIPDNRRADLKALAEKIASKRLSFCSAEEMQELLGVGPGSATPMAVINDLKNQVTLAIDEIVMGWDIIRCHPMTNAATIAIGNADFKKFIRHANHDIQVIGLFANG